MKKNVSTLFVFCALTLGTALGYARTDEPNSEPAAATENATSETVADSASLLRPKYRALTLATQKINDIQHRFPPAFTVDADGKPLHSWRVYLLPFLEELALYDQIRVDEPWDSEWNAQFHSQIPDAFASPDEPELAAQGLTRFGVVVGEETAFQAGKKRGRNFDDIKDGLSSTIAFVERKTPVCWMAPDQELTFEEVRSEGANVLFERPEGFFVARFDGSVGAFPKTVDAETILPFLTRRGADQTPKTLEIEELWRKE